MTESTPTKIEVISRGVDARAKTLQAELEQSLGAGRVRGIQVIDAYTIDKGFSAEEVGKISLMLTNPVTEQSTYYRSLPERKPSWQEQVDWSIEIGFLPGVTDNVATTARESIEDLLRTNFEQREAVYTSRIYLVSGDLDQDQAEKVGSSLANALIQRIHIKDKSTYNRDGGMDIVVPRVNLSEQPSSIEVNLNVSDEELEKIGQAGIASQDGSRRGPLALDLTSMKTIQEYFKKLGRNPSDLELESIAQTWSEHCKHTIFANPLDEIKEGIYKKYIKGATQKIRQQKGDRDLCVSVFTDNSGAFKFDDNYLVTHKAETHNSPSALDPFGGSITGIVGVNRDTIGTALGAKPILNTYGFCLADPNDTEPIYRDAAGTSPMLSPRKIMNGVIAGVNSGGNQSGIPTPQGFLYFNERYKGKPLVFVGTVGLIPKEVAGKPSHLKKAEPGDLVVVVGGRVGLDGIHGATFSSTALDSGSPATAVQIGDPITQKKLSDAIVKEARDQELYRSITDNGAGGISCSVAEMAKEAGGFKVQLEKVPLKYPGLDPWQIWISESQERMTLAVPPEKWEAFNSLMKRRGVEATVIGEFTRDGRCYVTYNGNSVMDMDMEFLHDGLPIRQLTSSYTKPHQEEPRRLNDNHRETLLGMLARQNVASTSFVSGQYDHEVQATSVLKPLQGRGMVNAEATVIRPVLTSNRGVGVSQGLYPTYSDIDPYAMAACSIDTAIRNLVAVGIDPDTISLLDNFCWCSSNDPERLGQLKLAAQACYDLALAYETPYISGKDSMFNDFKGYDHNHQPIKISIPPTLLVSSIGIIADATKSVSIDPKVAGDHVYIIGETNEELGASEYFAYLGNALGNTTPRVNASKNRRLYECLAKAIDAGLVASSISVTRGGLGVALAKMVIAAKIGLDINLESLPGDARQTDSKLYSESQGRIVVTVDPKYKDAFEHVLQGKARRLGLVTDAPNLRLANGDSEIVNLPVIELAKSYQSTFAGY
jgi:phosphoribosylformylglycinamidine synthase subunit PurSL